MYKTVLRVRTKKGQMGIGSEDHLGKVGLQISEPQFL